jgi:hypothetical protein
LNGNMKSVQKKLVKVGNNRKRCAERVVRKGKGVQKKLAAKGKGVQKKLTAKEKVCSKTW